MHSTTPYTQYISWGWYSTKTFGPIRRFRCRACQRTFSTQSFSVDYYAKRHFDYEDILARLSSTSCLRAIGRAVSASTDTISNRIARAARQVLAADARLSRTRRPCEDLVVDGFESFCVSQYFPNNIHLLVGKDSQFVYAADHVTLRRKGRMTDHQRLRRRDLEKLWRADPRGIERSFRRIAGDCLRLLSEEARPSLCLWTDEKREYPRAIASSPCASALREQGRIRHRTVSSRAARTIQNPLFAVNYMDREIRKDLHEHVRETTCFGRNVNRQMERLVVYLYTHNFQRRHRARGGVLRPADLAGYDATQTAKEKGRLWGSRAFLSLTGLGEMARDSWLRARETPLRAGRDYLPAYARG